MLQYILNFSTFLENYNLIAHSSRIEKYRKTENTNFNAYLKQVCLMWQLFLWGAIHSIIYAKVMFQCQQYSALNLALASQIIVKKIKQTCL